MNNITEEMKIHEQWYDEARHMTLERLPEWVNGLLDNYGHDYGTICHALSAGAVGTMWAMNNHPHADITGFQAGCIMWEVVRRWMDYKGSLKLVRYEDMLYPQYEYKFEKTISAST